MKRKAIQLSNKTLVVSLPIKWVKKFDIKKGDEINIEEKNNELIITKIKKDKPIRKIEIDISNLDEFILKRYLMAIYRAGYNEIKITSNKPIDISFLNKEIANMIGYEIVEQKPYYCLIKDIVGVKEEEFESILKRIFFILISTSEELLKYIKKNELEKLDFVINADIQINKFSNYCMKLLTSENSIEEKKRIFLYHIVKELELIGDILKNIARIIINSKPRKLSSEIIKLYEEFYDVLNLFFEFFYTFDIEKLKEIYNKKNYTNKIYENIIRKNNIIEIKISYNIEFLISLVISLCVQNLSIFSLQKEKD